MHPRLPLAAQGIRVDGVAIAPAMAGLRLCERWGGWKGEVFTGESSLHVSVYGR